ERVKAELAGTWTSTDTWGGLTSKLVVMAPYTNMPDDVRKMAQATEAAIVAGTLHPFKCPVIAQDGKAVECKNGKTLEDGQILSMNFYVKGGDDKMRGKWGTSSVADRARPAEPYEAVNPLGAWQPVGWVER